MCVVLAKHMYGCSMDMGGEVISINVTVLISIGWCTFMDL